MRRKAKLDCWTAGSARLRESGFRATGRRKWSGFIASATRVLRVKHFHEHLIKDHGFGWGYTWLKLHLQWAGVCAQGAAQGGASEEARAAAAAGMMLHQSLPPRKRGTARATNGSRAKRRSI